MIPGKLEHSLKNILAIYFLGVCMCIFYLYSLTMDLTSWYSWNISLSGHDCPNEKLHLSTILSAFSHMSYNLLAILMSLTYVSERTPNKMNFYQPTFWWCDTRLHCFICDFHGLISIDVGCWFQINIFIMLSIYLILVF